MIQLVKLCPGQGVVEVQRPGVGRRDERQVYLGLLDLGQLDLGLLSSLLETLGSHGVGTQVDTMVIAERGNEPLDDSVIPVITTEVGVSVGGLHLEDAVTNLQHRYVECAATKIEHQDRLFGFVLVEAVGQRGSRRLVDDAQHLEASDLARFLGGGALGVVEVGRHGDDGLVDGGPQVSLGVALELLKRAGRDLLRGVVLAVDILGPAGAHVTLDRPDGAPGVGDGLSFRHLADQHLAVLGERHHRRGGARALSIGDDDRVATLQHADDRVGSSEVDAHGLAHD